MGPTGELEDALSADKLEPAGAAASVGGIAPFATVALPQVAATAVLLRCLRRAISPDVVLPPLTDRFLRLALQLAQRYAAWIAASTAARREGAANGAGGAGAWTVVPPAPQGHGGVGSVSAGGASPSSSMAWAVTLPVDELLSVVADAETVSKGVMSSALAP